MRHASQLGKAICTRSFFKSILKLQNGSIQVSQFVVSSNQSAAHLHEANPMYITQPRRMQTSLEGYEGALERWQGLQLKLWIQF